MISVENDDTWFVPLIHFLNQMLCELIHLIDLIHIILPGILLSFVLHSGHCDLRILNHLFCRIIPMSLYTDTEHEILLFI